MGVGGDHIRKEAAEAARDAVHAYFNLRKDQSMEDFTIGELNDDMTKVKLPNGLIKNCRVTGYPKKITPIFKITDNLYLAIGPEKPIQQVDGGQVGVCVAVPIEAGDKYIVRIGSTKRYKLPASLPVQSGGFNTSSGVDSGRAFVSPNGKDIVSTRSRMLSGPESPDTTEVGFIKDFRLQNAADESSEDLVQGEVETFILTGWPPIAQLGPIIDGTLRAWRIVPGGGIGSVYEKTVAGTKYTALDLAIMYTIDPVDIDPSFFGQNLRYSDIRVYWLEGVIPEIQGMGTLHILHMSDFVPIPIQTPINGATNFSLRIGHTKDGERALLFYESSDITFDNLSTYEPLVDYIVVDTLVGRLQRVTFPPQSGQALTYGFNSSAYFRATDDEAFIPDYVYFLNTDTEDREHPLLKEVKNNLWFAFGSSLVPGVDGNPDTYKSRIGRFKLDQDGNVQFRGQVEGKTTDMRGTIFPRPDDWLGVWSFGIR